MNQFKRCDLHVHSCFSDGADSPDVLLEIAKKEGVYAVALCDHNTVSGLEIFEKAAQNSGITAVPGTEITAEFCGKEVHILGLFIDKSVRDRLTEYLSQTNKRKEKASIEMAERLKNAGFDISYDEVKNLAGKAIVNRVHFAKLLISKGYSKSVEKVFEELLNEGGEFYKPAKRFCAFDVISFLASINALPILAHPFLNLSYDELCAFLPKAKQAGLCAMEVYYSKFKSEQVEMAKELCYRFGILESGGSDYHGQNKPGIFMGRGKGELLVPFEVFENLYKAHQKTNK